MFSLTVVTADISRESAVVGSNDGDCLVLRTTELHSLPLTSSERPPGLGSVQAE